MRFLSFVFGALEFAFVFVVGDVFLHPFVARTAALERERERRRHRLGLSFLGGGRGAWRPLLSLPGRWHRAGGGRQHHWSLALRNLSFRPFPALVFPGVLLLSSSGGEGRVAGRCWTGRFGAQECVVCVPDNARGVQRSVNVCIPAGPAGVLSRWCMVQGAGCKVQGFFRVGCLAALFFWLATRRKFLGSLPGNFLALWLAGKEPQHTHKPPPNLYKYRFWLC